MSAYRKFVDTLQSEPRIPAPPKPPKPPKALKANPCGPVGLPVLGGLGTLGAPPIKNEISLHAATPPPLSFSARAVLDDFKDESAANGEHGSDMPLAATAIIAPAIVGSVSQSGGGRDSDENRGQPHAPEKPGTTLPSADTARDAMPVASGRR